MKTRPILLGAFFVAVVLGIVACGVPLDDAPRSVSMASTTTTSGSTTLTTIVEGDGVQIFFADQNNGLKAQVVAQKNPTVGAALAALLSAEPPTGLKSSIPSGTRLLSATADGQRVTVDLSNAIRDIQNPLDRVAYAQLTFTALAFPEFTEVTFEIEGEPVSAPTDVGNQTVVTANDYAYPLNPT